MYDVDLRTFFSPNTIRNWILNAPDIPDWALNNFYPDTNRVTHPFPVLGVSELSRVVKSMPVIKRGTSSIPLVLGSQELKYIEAQPVSPSSHVGAKELNDLKLLGDIARENWTNRRIEDQRIAVRKTTSALAVQSMSGSISYPMQTEPGVMTTYEINFGAIQTATVPLVWDDTNITLGSIYKGLRLQKNAIQRNSGYGSNIEWYAGENAFVALMDLVTALVNENRVDSRVSVTLSDAGINIGGLMVKQADGGYYNPDTGTWVDSIDTKTVKAVAKDAPFTLYYCALDSIKANLDGMPFFINVVPTEDPEGYKIIGMSKPVPVPVVSAICDMQVLA